MMDREREERWKKKRDNLLRFVAKMWHKAELVGSPMKLELSCEGLLDWLANHYTTRGVQERRKEGRSESRQTGIQKGMKEERKEERKEEQFSNYSL